MPDENMGPGLAELQQISQQRAVDAARRAGVDPANRGRGQERPAPRAKAGSRTPHPAAGGQRADFATEVNIARAAGQAGAHDDEEWDDEDDGPAPAPTLELDGATDDDLDELADAFEGKAKPEPKARKGKKKGQPLSDDEVQRALDRIKAPASVRAALEGMDGEEVDAWLQGLVQDQGNTDDALKERDQRVSTISRELAELKAKLEGKSETPPKAPTSNAPDKSRGDQSEDLAALRDEDPAVADALERRDQEIARLRKESTEASARLRELEKRHNAEAAAARREMVSKATRDLQEELGHVYPELNDVAVIRQKVAPHAAALLKAGLHQELGDALRAAAHAAFAGSQVVEDDRAALAARDVLGAVHHRTPVSKSIQATRPRARTTQQSQISEVYFAVRDAHPDWSDARVKKEALRRIGTVVPSKPFIS